MMDKEGFAKHLKRFGRSDGTVTTYMRVLSKLEQTDDLFDRLTDEKYSPKYRALNKAVLKSYAKFTKDDELLEELNSLKLPPAMRKASKQPLNDQEWHDLRTEIVTSNCLDEPVRAELTMLIMRGFRCGDVLRLRKDEINEALKSKVLNYQAKGGRRLEFTVNKHWRPALECFSDYFAEDWQDNSKVWELMAYDPESARREVTKGLELCAQAVGIEKRQIHPHLLRKTYATRFYNLCKDPLKLRDHMQWSSIETAMLYVAGAGREELDELAEGMFDA